MTLQPLAPQAAETLATLALAWLVKDQDLFMVFLGATGAGLEDVHAGAADPVFLGFVLDFMLSREDDLMAFCAELGVKPDLPVRARAALPGGQEVNWT